MPDIGLLQGGPLKPRVEAPAEPATHGQGAAPFLPSPIRLADLLWLLLSLALIVGTGLGIRDPWPADEPRFASLARDMVHSGEWLFPRVGGDLYQDKPPLFFWLLAVCYSLFGAFKGWFLIPSFIAAAGILFIVYDFGRRTVSREAGIAAAILLLCTVQFVQTTRGAQIDSTLCLLTTFSIYALMRHLVLGDGWCWYLLGGFAAGLGIITKGVGFLPLLLLIPFFLMRRLAWRGLADIDAGRLGWRYWLAPLAMLAATCLWLVPMLMAAETSPEYAAYRDEILLKQTVDRYATAWHHVKPWYYLVLEMIPPLWLPMSVLLIWLVPRFRDAFRARDARVWLPLSWVMLVLLFFSLSPGKRGVYILPALPVLAMATLPVILPVIRKRSVRAFGFVLALAFWSAALITALGHVMGAKFAVRLLDSANFDNAAPVWAFVVLGGFAILVAWRRASVLAWPLTLGALAVVFSLWVVPAINGKRSGADFVRPTLAAIDKHEQLALVAYKEQFLLYLDRPTVNFGHRRWLEGTQESFDASAWLMEKPHRVLLVPAENLEPCFTANVSKAGRSSNNDWFLVRAPAASECVAKGDLKRAILYKPHLR